MTNGETNRPIVVKIELLVMGMVGDGKSEAILP